MLWFGCIFCSRSKKKESCSLLNEPDPQVKALLEQFQANAAPQPVSSTPLSAHEKIVAIRQRMNASSAMRIASEAISKVQDFDIPSPAGKVPVRLYVPKTETPLPAAAPVFVYYHGGGFVAGDLETHDTLLRALANRPQCLVLSVAYRLAPENPYRGRPDIAVTTGNLSY